MKPINNKMRLWILGGDTDHQSVLVWRVLRLVTVTGSKG